MSTPPAKITGSFIDFSQKTNCYGDVLERDEAFWRQEFADMREAGIEFGIIARSVVLGRAHYASAFVPQWNAQDLLEIVFNAASETGLGLYLGLDLDMAFWDRSYDFEFLMKKDERWNRMIAEELAPRYAGHPALRGVYVSNELDCDNLDTPQRLEAAQSCLASLYQTLKVLFGLPVLSSPFFSNSLPYEELAQWWERALDRPMFDILAMQDGVGCRYRNLNPEDTGELYPLLASVCRKRGLSFWHNLETFDFPRHGEPLTPAPLTRMEAQYQAGCSCAERTITWEYGHFLGRQQVSQARYQEFRTWNQAAQSTLEEQKP